MPNVLNSGRCLLSNSSPQYHVDLFPSPGPAEQISAGINVPKRLVPQLSRVCVPWNKTCANFDVFVSHQQHYHSELDRLGSTHTHTQDSLTFGSPDSIPSNAIMFSIIILCLSARGPEHSVVGFLIGHRRGGLTATSGRELLRPEAAVH